MTPDQVKTTVQTIVNDLEAVSAIAAGVDPALIPFIAIGRAVANQIPGLAAGVAGWIEGVKPTPDEVATFASQLQVLSDPNAP